MGTFCRCRHQLLLAFSCQRCCCWCHTVLWHNTRSNSHQVLPIAANCLQWRAAKIVLVFWLRKCGANRVGIKHKNALFPQVREAMAAEFLCFCHIHDEINPSDVLSHASVWPQLQPLMHCCRYVLKLLSISKHTWKNGEMKGDRCPAPLSTL